MNLAKRVATLLLTVCCLGLTNSAFSEIYFKGYAKTYSVYTQAIELGNTTFSDEQFQQQSALRLMWAKEWSGAQLEFHYDVQPIAFSSDAFQASLTSNAVEQNPYRIDDLSFELGVFSDEREHHQTFQNLDRLNLQWQFEQGDLTVGRQAIGFGSARFVNPSDASKGLEFPFVWIMGLEEEILPHRNSIEADTIEEERRLMYVGITRAKQNLTLTLTSKRKAYGEAFEPTPSRFLEELPKDDIQREGFGEVSQEQKKARGESALAGLKNLMGS
jgi:hypothetical protein